MDYGFRLPSALDNRPLRFDEFMALVPRLLFVSATPGEQEFRLRKGVAVEQIIRPTGLVDPEVEVRPVKGQVDDLLQEIRERTRATERVLVTTLTKRMAEDLTDYLQQHGVRVRYLHSEIDAIERVEIIGVCESATSTFWSGSTCSRAPTCRKCPCSPCSTRTRRAFSGPTV